MWSWETKDSVSLRIMSLTLELNHSELISRAKLWLVLLIKNWANAISRTKVTVYKFYCDLPRIFCIRTCPSLVLKWWEVDTWTHLESKQCHRRPGPSYCTANPPCPAPEGRKIIYDSICIYIYPCPATFKYKSIFLDLQFHPVYCMGN